MIKLTNQIKKIPDITKLATKSSVTYLITETEDKIDKIDKKIPDISALATKTKLTAVENKIPDVTGFVKQSDYATEITKIKNDYATNASLDSKLNDLKSEHIADEVKKVDDKVKKNASNILGFENRLKKNEDIVDEVQRGNSFADGFYHYLQQSYLVYESRKYSFRMDKSNRLVTWRSAGIDNLSANTDLKAIPNAQGLLPVLKNNGRMNTEFNGNYFVQNKIVHPTNNKVVNIYIVYELDTISNTRNTDYTIQNGLFGAVKITKYADYSKKNMKAMECFDEGGIFSIGNITNGRNVTIFGVDESSVVHTNHKANNIYVMGDGIVQGIAGTTLYAEKIYKHNFTVPNKKFVL